MVTTKRRPVAPRTPARKPAQRGRHQGTRKRASAQPTAGLGRHGTDLWAIGLITLGVLLALARISGETAPLLFTALNNQFWSANLNQPMANLPVVIFQFATSPYKNWQSLAWTGALLITLFVLVLSIIARLISNLFGAGESRIE